MSLVAVVELMDWKCVGPFLGGICNKVLTAYDPHKASLEFLKSTQQIKCGRCGHLNGLGPTEGRRVMRR